MGKRNYLVKVGNTQYKHVTEQRKKDRPAGCTDTVFVAKTSINGMPVAIERSNARLAALDLDKRLIEAGRDPVNILVRKTEVHK